MKSTKPFPTHITVTNEAATGDRAHRSQSSYRFSPRYLPVIFTSMALAATALDSQAANVTFYGGPDGTGKDIGVATNWFGDVLPNPATSDVAIFDGTVPGNLALTYGGGLNGAAGNPGIQINIAASRTDATSIDSGAVTTALRLGGPLIGASTIDQQSVLINAGAGPFTLGDGAGVLNVTLGGVGGTAQFFTNNSASMATISSDVVFGNGGGGTHYFVFNGTGNWTVNSPIKNVSNVTLNGNGLVFMNGAGSTYTLGTYIGRGNTQPVLRAGATQALGTGLIEFDTTGNANTARLEVIGGISLNNTPINFTARNNTSVAIQNISGNNTLSGLMVLGTGGSFYTLKSDADTLAMTNTGTSTVTLNKTVYLQGAGNGSYSGILAGAGSLSKSGTGLWKLLGASTYTGTTTISEGTLQLGDGTTDGTLANTSGVTNNAALIYNWATAHTAPYVIGGTGTLTKEGAGTLTLGGTNTYTGTTTVNGGKIAVDGDSIVDTGTVVISGTGAIDLTGTEVVDKLFYGATQQVAGTYGSMDSSATFKDNTRFSGTGVLSVTSGGVVSAYASWATTKGLTDLNKGPTQDPDFDGISNALEFALGGDPLATNTAILPVLTSDETNLIFTFSRTDASEAEIGLVFQYGSDLAGWTDVPVGAVTAPPVTITENDALPDTVVISIPKTNAVGGKLFGRLTAVK